MKSKFTSYKVHVTSTAAYNRKMHHHNLYSLIEEEGLN